MPSSDLQSIEPVAWVNDLGDVEQILRAAATATAMHLAQRSGWEPDDSWIGNVLNAWGRVGRLASFGAVVSQFGPVVGLFWNPNHYEGLGTQVVTADFAEYRRLWNENYETYRSAFFRYALAGPGFLKDFFERTHDTTMRAREAINWNFRAARDVNDEVTQRLDSAYNRVWTARFAAEVTGVVAGSLASLGASLIFGMGYALGCTLAENAAMAEQADLVAYVRPPTVSGGVTGTQGIIEGVSDEELVAEAERTAQRKERLARRGIERQGGPGRAQRRIRQATNARRIASSARTFRRATQVAGKGFSIAAGLLFMRDELATMGHWLTTGEGPAEQQRAQQRSALGAPQPPATEQNN